MTRLLVVALLLSMSGVALAKPKPAKLAAKHCEPALQNAVQYEEAPAVGPASIALCRKWYGESASEAEVEALVCMAEAADRTTWDACRAPFTPVEPERRVTLEVRRASLDREIGENAGVLGALRDGSDLSGLEGGIGGLIGAKGVQQGSGLGGLGSRGSGASGYGSGGGHFGAKGEWGQATLGEAVILGELSPEAIAAVVKRHLHQIRYCYQRELTKDPELSGELVVKFVIAKDGSVSSAKKKSSTLGDAAVESCVTGRFMRMQFPEVPGGGIAIVSYPIHFAPVAEQE